MRTTVQILVVLLTLAILPVSPAQADEWGRALLGRMAVEGLVLAVNPLASTLVLRVERPERALHLGHLVVWVQQGTRVNGDDDRWSAHRPARDFRRGDRMKVDGFRLDDGRLLALVIDVKERAVASPPVVIGDVILRGVLVARGPNLIVIVDSDGESRIVLIVTTTRIRGLRTSLTTLQTHDAVLVLGRPNDAGALVAREVQVTGTSR